MKADKKAIVIIQKVMKNQIDDGCRLGGCSTCPIKMYNIVFTKDKIMKMLVNVKHLDIRIKIL